MIHVPHVNLDSAERQSLTLGRPEHRNEAAVVDCRELAKYWWEVIHGPVLRNVFDTVHKF